MNNKYMTQCKKVILNNKKSNRYVQLTIADKIQLIMLSRKIKKYGNINNITFEEFVLLCKHHKTSGELRIESKYSTTFINILTINQTTLYKLVIKLLHDIKTSNEEDLYENLDNIVYYTRINNVILFNHFINICKDLKVKVSIE